MNKFTLSKDHGVFLVFRFTFSKNKVSRKTDTIYFLYTSKSVTFYQDGIEGRGFSTIESDIINICNTKVRVAMYKLIGIIHFWILILLHISGLIQCIKTFFIMYWYLSRKLFQSVRNNVWRYNNVHTSNASVCCSRSPLVYIESSE